MNKEIIILFLCLRNETINCPGIYSIVLLIVSLMLYWYNITLLDSNEIYVIYIL